ncbi:MAG: glycine--tRNA ligase subunit beta [Gammaproteobacteria bacterium]|nr:glycine--tRNA ligase subunit beta [Gammaproteobacteria bacterium]MDE2346282.1 glycine--tRNA ligase subunit beta [Gammaproteobacteria bacterium]
MADTDAFLVEIGTEELPPKSLKDLALAFHRNLFEQLAINNLLPERPSEGDTFFSPRRLAVHLPKVLLKQKDRTEQRLGPSVSAAFDPQGRPTKAAEGFAKSCGQSVEQLQRKHTDKGERLACSINLKGKNAAELLPQIVSDVLAKLPIAKRMRWGAGEAQFVRPVHWVMLLLGTRPLKAEILGVVSGNKTYGHRFLHPAAITLKHPKDYRQLLATRGRVLVEDRSGMLAKKIAVLASQAAKPVAGKPQLDPELLQEVAALVEWPVPVTGTFDEKFLALPEEVIVAVLETQQRYFPLRDAKRRLLPKFIAISNIRSKRPAEIRRGNERVIAPRLSDAMFFWNSDRKKALAKRLPELEQVVFQKELGSYAEKSQRVARLAAEIAHQTGGNPQWAERAALLAKCDLVSGMVGEFPELQGVMGGYYAQHDVEPQEVAQAIAEQYRPRFADDSLPATKTGQALAIADKLDTVTGIFAIGRKPTGDKDPFGLRRAGLGLMRIAIERELEIDLHKLIELAVEQLQGKSISLNLSVELNDFLIDRLRAYYQESGMRSDVFDAVDLQDPGVPLDFHRRLLAVQAFLELPECRSLAAANKRIRNILLQAAQSSTPTSPDSLLDLDTSLLGDEAERTLHAALENAEKDTRSLYAQHRYSDALRRLAALRKPVDSFFDQVMVMTDDARLKNNRLALLQRVRAAFLRIADIGQLQVE